MLPPRRRWSLMEKEMMILNCCGDDYETLGAIQRRFSAYSEDGMEHNMDDLLHRPAQVSSIIIDSENEVFNSFVDKTNVGEGFFNCVDASVPTSKKAQPADLVESDGPDTEDVARMIQVEARVEELSKLMERVKILKDFQIACKKRTGRALSQKKDARVQLISVPKLRANAKFNDKNLPTGPPENAHVAYYKEALTRFAINVSRENWSKEEKENLIKGVKQQFQEMFLQQSVDLLSIDSFLVSIRDTDITPDHDRRQTHFASLNASILKREWTKEEDGQLRTAGRTGTQCSNRWLKALHPARKVEKWTEEEDMWVQCRERWVNSLDPFLSMAQWTEEEDKILEMVVAEHGYCWSKSVFEEMEGVVSRSKRPALGPNDFVMPEAYCVTASKNIDPSNRKRRRSSKDAVSGDICSEKVSKLSDSSEVENNLQGGSVPRKRRSKSTCSNDGIIKKKLRPHKKKLSLVSGSVDEPHRNEDEHTNSTEECLLPDYDYPDLQLETMNPELGVKKAAKLQCRRRHYPVATIETAGEGSTTTTSKMEMEKICHTNETNDRQPSPLLGSMLLTEAVSRI
ncbi:myb domain protein 4r1 [Striga asiatica]|uniref:Myb domain protein 4r1 n=1 Tax=Striga asiatica TaxID=4170 RepID=A0A5A7R9Z2_STRAF|nr:myb domain protein 4r1 [Striga asiatica]